MRGWFGNALTPKYNSGPLLSALKNFFGDMTLGDVERDVCITSVDLQSAKLRLHKSGYFDRNSERITEKLVDVALSTSAAPTFFEAHSSKFSSDLVDGGICANNPVMIALVDAFNFEGPSKRKTPPLKQFNEINRDRVVLVSLGTGEQGNSPYDLDKLKSAGYLGWGMNFHEVSMSFQSQLVHFQAKFLLANENYLRINPPLKFPMRLDEVSKIDRLKNLADLDKETTVFLESHF